MKLSIIIPVFNEAALLHDALSALKPMISNGVEVILVDGSSADETLAVGKRFDIRVVNAQRGRAAQQNAGAAIAIGDMLLFLHADTRLPANALELVTRALKHPHTAWGRFDVALITSGLQPDLMLRTIAFMMNMRSRWSGNATGDQCIFVRRKAFFDVGGFPEIPLMEDIALSQRLKKIARPVCLRERVETSARRWQTRGVWRTVMLMWWLRFAYWIGVSPKRLARWYGYA